MGDKKEKKQYSVISTDYHLLEEIGQGSTGTVYRAVCLPFNEVVAIKKLDLEKCCGNLDDVRREAQTMVLINHPNVVRAFCSFVVSQHLWVVMPYMGGGSCLHIMKVSFPDGFEEQIIATILKECLKALEYLHRQGHIHRDVKAGNILIDENGATKLGDFGVAACMFESGDRKWSRNTFVGTPCWMAPEVMEQLNGYDFKADIWSFGITALELAHGHAPFSKYPPMKVLLMTLQNAPPGLSYARDKKYSKAFKELIAMCLVKDPTKRPTAEKLLKHSFFKSAKSNEYIYRHLFEGLPPLWERVRNLKLKEASRLAEKKVPYEEQEERSQNEYKRGVSGWNFDVEDLKAQAALIQDDYAPILKKEDDEQAKFCSLEADGFHSLESIKLENIPEVVEVRSVPVATQTKLANAHKHESPCNTDFEESDLSDSPTCLDQKKAEKHEQDKDDQLLKQDGVKKYLEVEHPQDELKTNEVRSNDNEREEHHENNFSVSLPSVDEKEKDFRQVGRPGDESSRVSTQQDKLPNGSVPDHRPANGSTGLSRIPSGKEEDKSKGHVVQKKGRFSVTSADVNLKENSLPQANLRRAASAQGLVNQSGMAQTPSPVAVVASTASNVSVPAVLSHLQSLLNHTSMQQDTILNLMISVSTGENPTGQKLSHSRSMPPEHNIECWSDRERELRHQVAELQGRVVLLVDELQVVKLRNVQLERQLNAIFNKEEEERIRKEEAAREDG